MNEKCFAYRMEKMKSNGIMWKREYCDCLTFEVCKIKTCPFFKDKDTVKMIIVDKMTQYEDLK